MKLRCGLHLRLSRRIALRWARRPPSSIRARCHPGHAIEKITTIDAVVRTLVRSGLAGSGLGAFGRWVGWLRVEVLPCVLHVDPSAGANWFWRRLFRLRGIILRNAGLYH